MAAVVDVVAPVLGAGVDRMTVVNWCAAVGGRVVAETVLFEVETDKAVFEVEAEVTGLLCEILVPCGESAVPGAVVARVALQ